MHFKFSSTSDVTFHNNMERECQTFSATALDLENNLRPFTLNRALEVYIISMTTIITTLSLPDLVLLLTEI